MFECRLAQGSLLKKIMEAICPLVQSANIECSSSGLHIQAMDTANVCMVHLELSHEGFEPYRCDKNLVLGIDIANLLKIIRCGSNDSAITLKCQDNSDSIGIVITEEADGRTATFRQYLMDIDAEHLAVEDTAYGAVVKMPSHKFQRIVRELSQFGDTVNIKCTKEGVEFCSPSENGPQDAKILYQPSATVDSKDEVSIELNEPVTVAFASRYVGLITKATPLADSVTISVGHENPLKVEYNIGDIGQLRYYLAPKATSDDNQIDDE